MRGGNLYDKYGTTNPVARHLMSKFLAAFDELVSMTGATSALDVGCGEGHLSLRLVSLGLKVEGCDPDPICVGEANDRLAAGGGQPSCFVSDISNLGRRTADLVVCCEVLEHVDEPALALSRLLDLECSYLLLSVPREPIWRALNMLRGAYLSNLGNTPGHVNHWSASSFVKLVSARADIVAVRKPLPWTMVLARKD